MLNCFISQVNYWLKLSLMFLFNFTCFFATIASFRGIWYFLDYYLLDLDIAQNYIHPQMYSALGLMMLTSISALNVGVKKDDPSVAATKGIFINTYFAAHYHVQVSTAVNPRVHFLKSLRICIAFHRKSKKIY